MSENKYVDLFRGMVDCDGDAEASERAKVIDLVSPIMEALEETLLSPGRMYRVDRTTFADMELTFYDGDRVSVAAILGSWGRVHHPSGIRKEAIAAVEIGPGVVVLTVWDSPVHWWRTDSFGKEEADELALLLGSHLAVRTRDALPLRGSVLGRFSPSCKD